VDIKEDGLMTTTASEWKFTIT